MPAVTVKDTLVLPRVPEPDPAATADRPVLTVTTAPSAYEGEGFPCPPRLRRGGPARSSTRFIRMDQMGEVDYTRQSEPKGTSPGIRTAASRP